MDRGDRPDAPGPPTAQERAHFAAIGRAMADEKRLQIRSAARADTADGIVVGLQLAALFPSTEETRAEEERRAARQIELRRRAIVLRAVTRTGRLG